jgi:hypothetical protein
MKFAERIRVSRQVLNSARDAAAAGTSFDEWQQQQASTADSGWLEILMMLLPLILALFNRD